MSEMIYNCIGMEGESLKSYIRETLDFARPEDEVSFIVDTPMAVKEVEDYAIEHNHKTRIWEEEKGTKITIYIENKEQKEAKDEHREVLPGVMLVFNSSRFGQGNPRLGEKLMKHFLEAVEEKGLLPETILLYNSAVSLLTEESSASRVLKRLERDGVSVAAEEESAEFYNLKDSFVCGHVIPMGEAAQLLMLTPKVIKL